jgi:hypothetical protein
LSLGARLFPNPVEIGVPGHEPPPEQAGFLIEHATVSHGYFETLRIPIVEGRGLEERDREGAALVAVVDAAFATRFFPGGAVGRSILQGDRAITIVGIAAQSRYRSIDETPAPFVYLPFDQHRRDSAVLLVRSAGAGAAPVAALAAAVRESLEPLAPALPIPVLESLVSRIDVTFLPQRAAAVTTAVLGGVGLVLAAVGLYGVLGLWVAGRRHEIALRVALGAVPSDVKWLVLRQGLIAVVAGLLVGMPLALASSRLYSSFLVGVNAADPRSYAVVAGLLLSTALISSLLPALRAARSDPTAGLKDP